MVNTATGTTYKPTALANLMKYFFEHQITVKMFHFKTPSYSGHKESDAYLLKFGANFDQFMEVAQGHADFGGAERKVQTGDFTLAEIKIITTPNGLIGHLEGFVTEMNKCMSMQPIDCGHRGMAAIRDVMVADAQQLIYLLKFEDKPTKTVLLAKYD